MARSGKTVAEQFAMTGALAPLLTGSESCCTARDFQTHVSADIPLKGNEALCYLIQ